MEERIRKALTDLALSLSKLDEDQKREICAFAEGVGIILRRSESTESAEQ